MLQDTEFKHVVRIEWSSNWNDTCVYAIETFGLPGNRFITHANRGYMDFYFKNETDAIHFSLACL